MMGLPGDEKDCKFSRFDTIHQRDGRTPVDSKDRAVLSFARLKLGNEYC